MLLTPNWMTMGWAQEPDCGEVGAFVSGTVGPGVGPTGGTLGAGVGILMQLGKLKEAILVRHPVVDVLM